MTTQQIADRADIGTGTLFLYAKSKSELLLLVQNPGYAEALEQRRAAAEATSGALDGVLAIIRPIVECNRVNVENGRAYLRELVFGDPDEPHHRDALTLTFKTEAAVAAVLCRNERIEPDVAATLAQIVSTIMFVSMAPPSTPRARSTTSWRKLAGRVRVILPH